MTQHPTYAIGLSLGPMNQPTALAIVERLVTADDHAEPTYAVRHLQHDGVGHALRHRVGQGAGLAIAIAIALWQLEQPTRVWIRVL